MKEKIFHFLRSYIVPLGATGLAILFWNQYQCQGLWWFPYFIGALLIIHYFFFFRDRGQRARS